MNAPPPPKEIPRLPNLTQKERDAESRFADAYLAEPDGFVMDYRRRQNTVKGFTFSGVDAAVVLEKAAAAGLSAKEDNGAVTVIGDPLKVATFSKANKFIKGKKPQKKPIYEVGDAPNVFNTDDAKALSSDYNMKGTPEEKLNAKGVYNAAVHQTANAIAKRAFLAYLDDTVGKLPDDRKTVLVTSGGVASGKGYSLENVASTKALAQEAGAIWDAAGEQNATENEWVLQECKKRGIKCTFAFVHADPHETWENPKRGVVE